MCIRDRSRIDWSSADQIKLAAVYIVCHMLAARMLDYLNSVQDSHIGILDILLVHLITILDVDQYA